MKKISILFVLFLAGICQGFAQTKNQTGQFTESLMQDNCAFETTGRNPYFILEPGYRLILEGGGGKLVITVLNETKKIGNVETRIVEENESASGKTVEISRNFFAFCKQNGSVYYFGEEVDVYKDGKVINHEGAWTAEGKNKAGVAMPGLALLGARYYQEIAPGLAMDRAEIISLSDTVKTPAGNFTDCLKTEETSAVEAGEKEYKFYAPGIGLVREEDLLLTEYGFVK